MDEFELHGPKYRRRFLRICSYHVNSRHYFVPVPRLLHLSYKSRKIRREEVTIFHFRGNFLVLLEAHCMYDMKPAAFVLYIHPVESPFACILSCKLANIYFRSSDLVKWRTLSTNRLVRVPCIWSSVCNYTRFVCLWALGHLLTNKYEPI